MEPSLGSSLLLRGTPEASPRAGRNRPLIAWVACLGFFVLFQAGSAAAQQLTCDAATSVNSCDNKPIGSFCASGFGAQMSNCHVSGFTGEGDASCSCPDVDCTGGDCFPTKYGLGSPQDWDVLPNGFKDELGSIGALPPDQNVDHDDMVGSYTYNRGSSSPSVLTCNTGETEFSPVMGTWIFLEKVGCNPLDTGTNPAGCPVKLNLDANLDDETHPEHHFTQRSSTANNNLLGAVDTNGDGVPDLFFFGEFFAQVASSGTGFGIGHRKPNTATQNADCTGVDVPHICCTGAGTGACNADTRVDFDVTMGTPGGAPSRLCCNADATDVVDICTVLIPGGVAKYPVVGDIPSTSDVYTNFAGLEFDGDTANFPPFGKFEVDRDVILTGARYGVCRNNRTRPCDCGAGNGNSVNNGCINAVASDPCPGLGDTCDLREMGWRYNPTQRDQTPGPTYGRPNPNVCAKTPFVWRGTPDQNCLTGTVYDPDQDGIPGPDGDPGPDCSVLNYGPHQRPDLDCDGVADALNANAGTDDDGSPDYCPNYSETNMTADTNGDGRGDECQCGDADRNGDVTVSDLVATNVSIFNPPAVPDPLVPSAALRDRTVPPDPDSADGLQQLAAGGQHTGQPERCEHQLAHGRRCHRERHRPDQHRHLHAQDRSLWSLSRGGGVAPERARSGRAGAAADGMRPLHLRDPRFEALHAHLVPLDGPLLVAGAVVLVAPRIAPGQVPQSEPGAPEAPAEAAPPRPAARRSRRSRSPASAIDDADVQDEAQAITRFGMEDLDRANIVNVDGLAANVPGLHVGQSGPGRDHHAARDRHRERLHHRRVRRRLPRGRHQLRAAPAARVAFFDLETLDVKRGPQGLLGGKNSTSGSINVRRRAQRRVRGRRATCCSGTTTACARAVT